MNKVNDKAIRSYLKLLWTGTVIMLCVSPVAAIYQNEISKNPSLLVLMLLLMVPVGITYITLAIDIIGTYKKKVLFLLPLVFFPVALVVVISLAPFAHLVAITLKYRACRSNSLEGFK